MESSSLVVPGQPYVYEPFDPNQPDPIRLILLQPSRDPSSPIECSLIHKTLSECEDDIIDHYTALSYVWGDSSLTETIRVDGKELFITISLHSALQNVRDSHRPIYIWADAICINQRDIGERNQQVAQMGQIYTSAHHTVIHLGDSIEGSKVLENIWEGKPYSSHDAGKYLLGHSWFERIWILQELVLSRDPRVQCGFSRLRWDDFCGKILNSDAEESFKDRRQLAWDINKARMTYHGKDTDPRKDTDSEEDTYRPKKMYPSDFAKILFTLLQARRGLGVTDGRDMVFAHLGIASGNKLNGQDISTPNLQSSFITVDYRKTQEQLYHDVALFILAGVNSWDVLSCVNHGTHGPPEFSPSWIPNWTIKPAIPNISQYMGNSVSKRRRYDIGSLRTRDKDVLSILGWTVGVIRGPISETLNWPGKWPLGAIRRSSNPDDNEIKSICNAISQIWPCIWPIPPEMPYTRNKFKIKKAPQKVDFYHKLVSHLEELPAHLAAVISELASKKTGNSDDSQQWDKRKVCSILIEELERAVVDERDTLDDVTFKNFCRLLLSPELLPIDPSCNTYTLIGQLLKSQLINGASVFHGRKSGLVAYDHKSHWVRDVYGGPQIPRCLIPQCAEEGDVIVQFAGGDIPFVLREIHVHWPDGNDEVDQRVYEIFCKNLKNKRLKRRVGHYKFVGECWVEGPVGGRFWTMPEGVTPRIFRLH